jgi:dTDP-4-dehydrorhamnose reductase
MKRRALELWGGPECTVNRVGDAYRDQFARSGHGRRLSDLDLFSELGIQAIRYPISWERISPERDGPADWRQIDPQLRRMRELGIRVIAGLVHHGGGPIYTDLLDDDGFALGLAAHAGRVARRYPWLESWAPVNEPLTTARFSALYGHWYPHRRDESSFWRALLNQIDGVRLSMAAVRLVNPAAKLIQTDDLGRTYATSELRSQAAFDNLRRWAGWDLLCGRVTPQHPLWDRLCAFGLEHRLGAIADAPCPPDIIGVNHYPTSDRFLDHRLSRYPVHTHGGNGREPYADVEAVRVLEPPPAGLEGALSEAWARYRIPLVVSEVHNGCTREEQMRWMAEAWDTGRRLVDEGIDLRAVTIWALLGSYDWNTLLTSPGVYEPGVFDMSSGEPRATALAPLMRGLRTDAPRPIAARDAGWWRRPARLVYSVVHRPAQLAAHLVEERPASGPPLLVLGATGTLGQAFASACAHRNLAYVLTSRAEIDLTDPRSIASSLDRLRPWAIVNAAGWVDVDAAETHAEACLAINGSGAIALSAAASERGIPTLNFSSDLVFDGLGDRAYVESDSPAPLGIYGKSKALMEAGLVVLPGRHLIVRTAAFFSPFDAHNFAMAVHGALTTLTAFDAASDIVVTPTYVPHLVDAALDLLIDGEQGVWHLTNGAALSWSDFAFQIAETLGLPSHPIRPRPALELRLGATRPRSAALSSARGGTLPPLALALADFGRCVGTWSGVRAA